MLSQKQIKTIRSLQQKKFRQELNLFVVEGEKMVNELLASNALIKSIYCTVNSTVECNLHNVEVVEISEDELVKISSQKNPNNILAVVEIQDKKEIEISNNEPILVLDKIQDPGNLGTIIRTADWFGINKIYCTLDTVDLYNPKVVQSTMGSIFRVNVVYTDIQKLFSLAKQKNIPIIGTVIDGENMYQSGVPKNGLWVIGNEANGISAETKSVLDYKIRIPSYPEASNVESLNASIAAALICSEIRRQ